MSDQNSSVPTGQSQSLRDRLGADLTAAMKQRDRVALTVIRRLLAAIANSEAVPVPDGPYDPALGLGHDVPRQALDDAALAAIVDAEIELHQAGIAAAENAGRTDRADLMRAELGVLHRYR